ncbi:Pr6Pr family membrane protein [Agrococcus sp. ARC_14]|uniref:Pr6Pr family membrane protein n=1 Tax=Agrococcus sp. ARC_14 TaxID=2919927 RepID=UPI001F067AC0|nr:Pr6Pr family membrane protein [Agrococcus sp. ARC_14]MCH1881845.1 Pr6Pr family membrane protein [Agrococcus sp. ARC_14]
MVQLVGAHSVVRGGSLVRALLIGRLFFIAVIIAAIVGQLLTSLSFWGARGFDDTARNIVGYFSFFTVQSNLLSLVVLGILVSAPLVGRPLGRRLHVLQLATTSYMVVTGIIYNTQMRGIELPQGATLDWSNEVLHVVAPVWMLLEWLAGARERDLQWRDLGTVAIFPLAWLGYTLLRAPKTDVEASTNPYWYPQLDPASYDSGYLGVAGMCLAIATTLIAVAAAQLAYARWRGRPRR